MNLSSDCVMGVLGFIMTEMKRFAKIVLIFLGVGLAGCSKEHLAAKYYLFQAEQTNWKVEYTMKLVKKESYEKRFPFYEKACKLYGKAYALNKSIFNLENIRNAANVCARATDSANEEEFTRFEMVYVKAHPVESEYGTPDAMPIDSV